MDMGLMLSVEGRDMGSLVLGLWKLQGPPGLEDIEPCCHTAITEWVVAGFEVTLT